MKDAFHSKTIIAALVGIAAVILEAAGLSAPIADPDNPSLNEIIFIISNCVVLYGRITAKTPIHSVAGVKLKPKETNL